MAERGIYRSIPCALLAGKDFRALPERARWIFVVLKMNIGAVGIDTWYPDELISRLTSESGATVDQVNLTLEILAHAGWIEREDNVIWVKQHLHFDPHLVPSNPKHRKSVQRHVAGMPRLGIIRRFVAENAEWFPQKEAIAMGMEWVSNGEAKRTRTPSGTPKKVSHTHSDQEKEKEDEKDSDKPPASGEAVSPFAFMGRINAIHREFYGGEPPKGTATALAPLVAALGVDDLEARFRVYCQQTQAAFLNIPKFARTWKAYSAEPTTPKLIGVGGEPTPEELASIGIRLT